MSASATDKITDTRNATRPVGTTVSGARSAGGATLQCAALTGWPTASKVHFVTYQVDSNSNEVTGSQLDCYGIVSGNNITQMVVVDGTDTGNSIGDIVEMLPTAAWGQDLADALTTEHDRTGAHKAGTTLPSPVISGTATGTYTLGGTPTITAPIITDFTNANHTHASTAQGGVMQTSVISNPYKFSVYRNAGLTSAVTETVIPFDTKIYDTGNNVDVTTNKGRFTAPVAGFYHFSGTCGNTVAASTPIYTVLFVNGVRKKIGSVHTSTMAPSYSHFSGTVQLAANDYVELAFLGGNGSTITTAAPDCWFEGHLVSAT